MNPFVILLSQVIELLNIAILVWFVLGILISFKIVNRSHVLVYRIDDFLSRLLNPLLNPIRKYLPPIGGIDLSPIILILLLNFLRNLIVYYL